MKQVTVYEKPSCTTCRKLIKLLAARDDVEVTRIDYHVTGLTEPELREILRKTGATPNELLRRRGVQIEELGLGPDSDPEKLIRLMVQHPALMERPVVLVGDRGVLARPVERVNELLDA